MCSCTFSRTGSGQRKIPGDHPKPDSPGAGVQGVHSRHGRVHALLALAHMVAWSHSRDVGELSPAQGGSVFVLHVTGFAFYVWLTSYLLVRDISGGRISILLFTIAMGAHFLTIDHSLRCEHGPAYERVGRKVLALAAILGWGVGCITELPKTCAITLLGFISGGVIMNSMIVELPRENEGRFWFFLVGGAAYAALLIPLT